VKGTEEEVARLLDAGDLHSAAAAIMRAYGPAVLAYLADQPRVVQRLGTRQPAIVTTLAGAGNTAAVAVALDLGFPLPAAALSVAVWRERTETVRLLLARGAVVSDSVLSLAERALIEMSEWTPHHSPEIIDALRNNPRTAPPTAS